MLIADLESKVAAAIQAALAAVVADVKVYRSWHVEETFGETRNEEDEKSALLVGLALSTFARPTFTAPQMTTNGALTLTVRQELDPSGDLFRAAAEAVDALFQSWQSETYQAMFLALDIAGPDGETVLSVDNVSVDPATPHADEKNRVTTITFPFTLSGTTP